MIEIVGIVEGMREQELRLNLSIDVHELVESVVSDSQRVVAKIEKDRLRTENLCRSKGFFSSRNLHFVNGHAWLSPQFG